MLGVQVTDSYKDRLHMLSLTNLLLFSLAVAVLSVIQPWVWPWGYSPTVIYIKTFAPAAIWALVLVISLIIHGVRGVWILVGAPLALAVPILSILVDYPNDACTWPWRDVSRCEAQIYEQVAALHSAGLRIFVS